MQNKKAYIWNFGGSLIPQVLFLLTNIVLARFLTPSDFGAVGVLSIFVSLASTLTDTGFSGSLVKEKTISPLDCSTVFVFNLSVSCTIYILLFLSSALIESFFSYPGLQYIVRSLCLVFVIRAIGIVPRAQLTRNIRFDIQAKIAIFSVTIACIVAIIGGIIGWKSYALVAYQLIYAFVETVLLISTTKYKISLRFSVESFKRLFSFGFFTTICTTIDTIYENIMAMLFGKFLNMSAAGYLSQAQKLEVASTNSLVRTLNSVSFPILTKKRDDIPDFIRETNSIQQTFISLIFPVLFIIIIFAKEIVVLLYGKEWLEAGIYLQLLIFVGMFYILECLDRNNIKSLGQVKALSKITIIKRGIGLSIILACLLISPFSMLYGYIISTMLGFLFNKALYCKITGVHFIIDLWRELRLLIAPSLFAISAFITRYFCNYLLLEIILCTILTATYYYFTIRHSNLSLRIFSKRN